MDAFNDSAGAPPPPPPPPPSNLPLHPTLRCPVCQAPLQVLGQLAFRTGGPDMTTAAGFFFTELLEVGERLQRIDTYRCSRCGRLEMYDHDFSLPLR